MVTSTWCDNKLISKRELVQVNKTTENFDNR